MRLEPFTPEEFDRWRREAQDRFADLRAGTGTMTAAQAADRAAGTFTRLLPQGVRTPGHLVRRVLDDGGEVVGDLWLQVDSDAFLYDIRLTPEAVDRGRGTAAMDLVEQTARERAAAPEPQGVEGALQRHAGRRLPPGESRRRRGVDA